MHALLFHNYKIYNQYMRSFNVAESICIVTIMQKLSPIIFGKFVRPSPQLINVYEIRRGRELQRNFG